MPRFIYQFCGLTLSPARIAILSHIRFDSDSFISSGKYDCRHISRDTPIKA